MNELGQADSLFQNGIRQDCKLYIICRNVDMREPSKLQELSFEPFVYHMYNKI